jgi:hypothetical protein
MAPNYAVTFDAQTQSVAVQLCLADAHAKVAFAADSGWAMRFISDVKRGDAGSPGVAKVDSDDSGWHAANWRAGECLSWRADLRAIAQEHKPDVGWQMGEDFIAAPQLWLLRPMFRQCKRRVEHPDARALGDFGAVERAYAVIRSGEDREAALLDCIFHKKIFPHPNTPPDWSAAVAFGRFTEERIALPAAHCV